MAQWEAMAIQRSQTRLHFKDESRNLTSMKSYWLKELVRTPLYLPNGGSVPFEEVGGSYGILETSDPYLTTELQKAAKNQVGGVIQLSEEDFKSWQSKKKASPSSLPSPQQPGRQELEPMSFQRLQEIRAAGAVAAGSNVIGSPNQAAQQATQQKVQPLVVPQQFSKPKVGRVPKAPAPPPPAPVAPLNAPPPTSHVQGT